MTGGRRFPRLPARRARLPGLLLLALSASALVAHAHERHAVTARLEIFDDHWELKLPYDIPALMTGGVPFHAEPGESLRRLGEMTPDEGDRAAAQAERFLRINLRMEIDGRRASPDIVIPDFGEGGGEAPVARLRGPIPPGGRSLVLAPGRALGSIDLVVVWPGREGVEHLAILHGRLSDPVSLLAPPPPDPRPSVFGQYLMNGLRRAFGPRVEPFLLALGLWFLTSRWRDFATQWAAFVAGSLLTLILAAGGYLDVPPEIARSLILISVLAVALENLLVRRMHTGRPTVVFVFGLFIGLELAGGLAGAALPRLRAVPAVAGYGLGALGGLLGATILTALALTTVRNRPWYAARVAAPASGAIGLAGIVLGIDFILSNL
jgi:hypothetical protein